MSEEKRIYVFADFPPYSEELIGTLYATNNKGKEFFSFEYSTSWLSHADIVFDPDLQLFGGRQFTQNGKEIFGVFADSSPDRWGRTLMQRREQILAKISGDKPRKLCESDYLLGVFDESRMGGLRFKTDSNGNYLSYDPDFATPPWASLRDLEQAVSSFERDENGLQKKWIHQLIAPGSSLGGARPKASVIAPDGSLWIAKFPSRHDEFNVGAWEMVVHDLAKLCDLNVPDATVQKLSKYGTTYLTKRFDRNGHNRIHFASAMTMLGKTDGADAADGSSYLEIASFLKANGAKPKQDLEELWKRIVFSMAVSNTDDHFRNHGFILTQEGWVLSPLFDVNPDIYGDYLSLNVDDQHADIDFRLAVDAASFFGISADKAKKIVDTTKKLVKENQSSLAKKYGITRGEIERMQPAFRLCEQ